MQKYVQDLINSIKNAQDTNDIETVGNAYQEAKKLYEKGKITRDEFKKVTDKKNEFHKRIIENSNPTKKGKIIDSD